MCALTYKIDADELVKPNQVKVTNITDPTNHPPVTVMISQSDISGDPDHKLLSASVTLIRGHRYVFTPQFKDIAGPPQDFDSVEMDQGYGGETSFDVNSHM
jgi:hypothetical protein